MSVSEWEANSLSETVSATSADAMRGSGKDASRMGPDEGQQ